MKSQLCSKTLIAWLCSVALLSAAEPAGPGNLLPNGNFEPAKDAEVVPGWELPPKDWQAQKGFTAAILDEKDAAGADHWLGLTSSAPELTVTASTTVALPPGTRGVRLAGRFRVEKLAVDTKQNWTGAFIGGSVLDAKKKKIGGLPTGFRFREATGGWVKREAVLKLPEGAAFLLVQPGIFLASGDFGVDDLEISTVAVPVGTLPSAAKKTPPSAPLIANVLALDFNGDAAALPAMEAFSSASAVQARQAFANEGTIDTFRGDRSGAVTLNVDASKAEMTWSAGMRTPLLAVENAETALAKLTLSFDLQASQPRPLRVRVTSFDAKRKQTGGLEKWVYPPVAGSFYRHSLDLSEMTAGKGKFDPAAPFLQLSWEIASDAPQPWPKTDGLVVRVDNVSLSRPGYYVSASGSDKADGRTEATAFLTIKKAVAAAQAGDTVLVMDGTYPLGGGVSFETSGTPAKWITLKRAPGAKPRLEFASWSGLAVKAGAAFVEINGLEVPAVDGSCLPFCESILEAGLAKQGAPRMVTPIEVSQSACDRHGDQWMELLPSPDGTITADYRLDFGADASIPAQSLAVRLTVDSFLNDIAGARTFVRIDEIESLQQMGFGRHLTGRDLLVFETDGSVVDNRLRWSDEPVRHKILDCIGDLALSGRSFAGQIVARRSGHKLNHVMAKTLATIEGCRALLRAA